MHILSIAVSAGQASRWINKHGLVVKKKKYPEIKDKLGLAAATARGPSFVGFLC
jgi:hypothetical protein